MAVWRRRALAAFPELRDELNSSYEIASIYDLWRHLLPITQAAHARQDEHALDRIYAFALWCSEQHSKELWNSVAVSFYEHLPDTVGENHLADMLRGLPDRVIIDVWGLWQWRLPEALLTRVRNELKAQRRPVPA